MAAETSVTALVSVSVSVSAQKKCPLVWYVCCFVCSVFRTLCFVVWFHNNNIIGQNGRMTVFHYFLRAQRCSRHGRESNNILLFSRKRITGSIDRDPKIHLRPVVAGVDGKIGKNESHSFD
jgi:hypothetical protein